MTIQIKAFLQVEDYVNNVVGQNAMYGELSNYSESFAIEKGYYAKSEYPGQTLTTFTSTNNDVKTYVTSPYLDNIFKVMNYVLNYSASNMGTQWYPTVLLNMMNQDLAADGSNFDCGNVETDSTRWLPEWVSWKSTLDNGDNTIIVWLKDDSFQNQYDDYEIIVVPPVDNLDNFFNPATQVSQMISALTYDSMIARVQAAKSKQPETIVTSFSCPYHNPLDTTQTVNTTWGLLIYGAAGNDPDAIQTAMIDYILAHSTHPESDWEIIFPDIFRRTEFLILPSWWKYAIQQRDSIAGIYSPLVNVGADISKVQTWVNSKIDGYTFPHLAMSTETYTHNYRCLNLTVIGGPKNRDDKFLLSDWWSDLLNIANTTPDFARMQQATCDFANQLNMAIPFAETWKNGNGIITGLRKVKRNGVYWLCFSANRVNYLVWPRLNGDYV